MTLQLLKPLKANGQILVPGTKIKIETATGKELIRQGIAKEFPEPAVVNDWPEDIEELIEWFISASLPQEPFSPSDYECVLDPVKYYAVLRREIAAGPKHPRARVLPGDLQRLRDYCERIKQ